MCSSSWVQSQSEEDFERVNEEAFNAAQAVMREKYAPYYWAAFVLVR